MLESHIQYSQKLNIWTSVLNNVLIEPFFIDSDLTTKKYETMLTMLRDRIFLVIRQVASTNFAEIWYQQDSASPQWYKDYSTKMRAYLTQYRWIGRKGKIEWPARSPDLTLLDFFLWDYLKNKLYNQIIWKISSIVF